MSMLLQSTIYLGWCYLVTKSSKMYWDYLIETVKMKVSDEQYKKKNTVSPHKSRYPFPIPGFGSNLQQWNELCKFSLLTLTQQKLVSNWIYVALSHNSYHMQSFTIITVVWLKPKEQRKQKNHNM